jgi:ketosteroid isomerase-like protein
MTTSSGATERHGRPSQVAGRTDVREFAVRVTSIYRNEEDGWRLIHRHADPRVSRQTAESVLEG